MPTWGTKKIETDWNEFYRVRGEIKRALIARGFCNGSWKFNEVLSRKMKKRFGHS